MIDGYVKLWRSTLDWEWFDDANTLKVWLYILLSANWKEGKFKGDKVPIGSLIRSLERIACDTGLSKSQVRTAITHLKNTGEITTKIARKNLLITIGNWSIYQSNEDETCEKIAPTSHDDSTDRRKKERKNKNILNIDTTNINNTTYYFVQPTLQEVRDYIAEKGLSVDAETFYNYYEANGWKVGRNKMKSWKSSLSYWNSKNKPKEEYF